MSASAPASTSPNANVGLLELARTQPVAAAACVLEAQPMESDGGMLRLRKSGAAFVHVEVSAARVEIPIGEEIDAVFVELIGSGWHVQGHLDIKDFAVHPARILSFGGFLRPTQFERLGVTGARLGQLMLGVTSPSFVTLDAPLPPEPAACEDVTIGMPPQSIGADDLPTGHSGRLKRGTLAQHVALRVDPSAQNVASLSLTEDVEILEQRGGYTRIASTQYTTNVYGWVPTRAVHVLRPQRSEGSQEFVLVGMLAQSPPTQAPIKANLASCHAELSLIAVVNEETMQVGTIEPATILETSGRDRGLVWLVPPKSVKPLDGVKFGVLEAELDQCVTH